MKVYTSKLYRFLLIKGCSVNLLYPCRWKLNAYHLALTQKDPKFVGLTICLFTVSAISYFSLMPCRLRVSVSIPVFQYCCAYPDDTGLLGLLDPETLKVLTKTSGHYKHYVPKYIPSKTASTYLPFSFSFLLLPTVFAPCIVASLLQSFLQVFSCLISFSLEAYFFRNSTKHEKLEKMAVRRQWIEWQMLLLTTPPIR